MQMSSQMYALSDKPHPLPEITRHHPSVELNEGASLLYCIRLNASALVRASPFPCLRLWLAGCLSLDRFTALLSESVSRSWADQARGIFDELFAQQCGKKQLSTHTFLCASFVKALMPRSDLAKVLCCVDRCAPLSLTVDITFHCHTPGCLASPCHLPHLPQPLCTLLTCVQLPLFQN